jgi:hypothetical protein
MPHHVDLKSRPDARQSWRPAAAGAAHGFRSLFLALAVVAVFASSGCYHYRVVTPDAPATEYHRKTLHGMFWGLLQHDADVGDCVSDALVEVRVRNNAGYMLLSVVTLGIWAPLDVEWRCAKIPAIEGEL